MKNLLPKLVILAGIEYRTAAHEGMIVFTSTLQFGPCYTRICFSRESNDIWKMSFDSSSGMVCCNHVVQALRLVEMVYGKSHTVMAVV